MSRWIASLSFKPPQLLLAGVHPKIAQERLGHSTIATTLDIYGHVGDRMQEDAAAKIDVALRG
jgi:integrase